MTVYSKARSPQRSRPGLRQLLRKVAFAASLAIAAMATTVVPSQAATIDVGTQTGTYPTNVRGFWFTAPIDFLITGVDVPTTASTGTIYAALLRLAAVPPNYSSTTTDYDVLYELRDSAIGSSGLSIMVNAGDIIGVLGYRGGLNSYATAPVLSSVLGAPITLTRFGTQNDLRLKSADGLPVWTEAGGSISQVILSVSAVSPSEVPLPAAGFLLLGGLGALSVFRRRRPA